MKKNQTWTYVGRATKREKYYMQEIIEDESKFQQQEPHGWDEDGRDCPIHFQAEKHGDWQMQAYTPSGKMMDGFHEGFIRCGNCGAILSYDGCEDYDPHCWHCETDLINYKR